MTVGRQKGLYFEDRVILITFKLIKVELLYTLIDANFGQVEGNESVVNRLVLAY
jgi:hypothetical protein